MNVTDALVIMIWLILLWSPPRVYECNKRCKCDPNMCTNRLVQHGLQVRLQLFKTQNKGWGIRCLDDIAKGSFVCIYAGWWWKGFFLGLEHGGTLNQRQVEFKNKMLNLWTRRKKTGFSSIKNMSDAPVWVNQEGSKVLQENKNEKG